MYQEELLKQHRAQMERIAQKFWCAAELRAIPDKWMSDYLDSFKYTGSLDSSIGCHWMPKRCKCLIEGGYYRVRTHDGRTRAAHLVSLELYLCRELRFGMMACHKPECLLTYCFHPEHSYEGTAQQNAQDRYIVKRAHDVACVTPGYKHTARGWEAIVAQVREEIRVSAEIMDTILHDLPRANKL